jgi:lysophospholipase L1-like esterase
MTGAMHRRRLVGAVAAAALVTGAAGVLTAARAAPAPPGTHEIATWGASADRVSGTLVDQTVRDIVHTSIGGTNLRVEVSNAFGDSPVTFGRAFVGVRSAGAAIKPGTNRQITFSGGNPSVTIPAGAEVLSDPLPGAVAARQDLAVSLDLTTASGNNGVITGHNLATSNNYYSTPGDHSAEEGADAFTTSQQHWWFLDAVVVDAPASIGTIATLGDSITDGFRSTVDANNRWPDQLELRIANLGPNRQYGIMNEGISGNQTTADGAGVSAQARLDRDVLAKPGVETVIFMEGINDIGRGTATSADQLIQADQQVINRVHAAGKCILGGTLTPFVGASYSSPAKEQIREALNQWIRRSGAFDGVIDFDRATRDPDNPTVFLPAYDSGDHLHPNPAGYQAMAAAVRIPQLACD